MLNVHQANEQDVREEIVSPLLDKLGYKRDTENYIIREHNLRYPKRYLGHKKASDPLLRGRADYLLGVLGVARWILEVKAPSEAITQETIEQAMSYARHPEVSASYTAITNGKRFVLFHQTQASDDNPMIDFEIICLKKLYEQLSSTLSPYGIRRDCSPPIVDLGHPLADGLRSFARITSGEIHYLNCYSQTNLHSSELISILDDEFAILKGYRTSIKSGRIWRDEDSKIKAKIIPHLPHDKMFDFAQDKNLLEMEFLSLDAYLSQDADNPSAFDIKGNFAVSKGEFLYNMFRSKILQIDLNMNFYYAGQASGCLKDDTFSGNFHASYEYAQENSDYIFSFVVEGEFTLNLDNRGC